MCKIHYLRGSCDVDFRGWSLVFGVFDGVHRGHQFLVEQAKKSAHEHGGNSGVLTFSIDPDELFDPDGLIKLMTNGERLFALADTGVDEVFVLPFDFEFAAKSPDEFLNWVFGAGAPSFIHVGEGFRFGSKGSGTVANLAVWGAEHGMSVCEHELLAIGGDSVSSTRIRNLLAIGRFWEAFALLGPTPAKARGISQSPMPELAQISFETWPVDGLATRENHFACI